jgi:Flp pilus assembly protein TadB
MMLLRVLLMIGALSFSSRTVFRLIGHKKQSSIQNFDVFCSAFLLMSVFFATKMKFFLLVALCFLIFLIITAVKRISKCKHDHISDFLDQTIMNMRSGMSFELAQKHLFPENGPWIRWLSLSNSPHGTSTNGQEAEIILILRVCRAYPSQIFRILSCMRSSIRLQRRLHRKQQAMTLQAKAQATVSCFIFVGIFSAQLFLQPQFLIFLKTSGGKLTVAFSFFFLLAGVRWVFWLAKPREITL